MTDRTLTRWVGSSASPPSRGLQPQRKGNPDVLKDGSPSHRDLMPAVMTPQQHASHRRTLLATATRTTKPFRPTQLPQVCPATFLAAQPRVEFLQAARIVFHALVYCRQYTRVSHVHTYLTQFFITFSLWRTLAPSLLHSDGEGEGVGRTPIRLDEVDGVRARSDNLRLDAGAVTRASLAAQQGQ